MYWHSVGQSIKRLCFPCLMKMNDLKKMCMKIYNKLKCSGICWINIEPTKSCSYIFVLQNLLFLRHKKTKCCQKLCNMKTQISLYECHQPKTIFNLAQWTLIMITIPSFQTNEVTLYIHIIYVSTLHEGHLSSIWSCGKTVASCTKWVGAVKF